MTKPRTRKPAAPRKAKEPAKIGRPSTYSLEMAEAICAALPFADGGLEEVCKRDGMPSTSTVFRWLAAEENSAFREMYAHAREMCGHVQAGRGMTEALTATDAALGRLKFDARKWLASKLAPKSYGDKVALVGGDKTDAPLVVEIRKPE